MQQHRINLSAICNIISLWSSFGLMVNKLDILHNILSINIFKDVIYYNYFIKNYEVFSTCYSVVAFLQDFCCSSLLVQTVGRGDLILSAHQDRNHNAQSIRRLTFKTTSLTQPTVTTTFNATATGSPFADRAQTHPTSFPTSQIAFGRWTPPASTTMKQVPRYRSPHICTGQVYYSRDEDEGLY